MVVDVGWFYYLEMGVLMGRNGSWWVENIVWMSEWVDDGYVKIGRKGERWKMLFVGFVIMWLWCLCY